MASLYLEDGRRYDNTAAIVETLAPLGVTLSRWDLPDNVATGKLLAAATLDEERKAALLAAVDPHFDELKQNRPYTARDLVVLHESQPDFDELTASFRRPHSHADDEVRYILDGLGYFGLIDGRGRQLLLKVVPGEYINVPAGVEHWFELGAGKRVKAVRYFTEATGWQAEFTNRVPVVRPPVAGS